VGLVLGVDGGNSKTDVVLATTEGEPLHWARGGGSNAHGKRGYAGCIDVIDALVELGEPADRAVLFLCGADLERDVESLSELAAARGWAREVVVDNDTFALLHAGSDAEHAVAVICGSGINCVGRSGGRVVRYPALGWETGDWGGAEALGREALYLANRAADGRGEPTALVELIESHFGKPVVEVGAEVHYRTIQDTRLGALAPAILELDDPVARRLVQRLADEVVLLYERAARDLGVGEAEIVLGGGMLAGRGPLFRLVAQRLPREPAVPALPPVAGAVLAALDGGARERFRAAFAGWSPNG
jgi:N-acetylglucosamine kinase-like BadF-type ATPase